MSDESAHPMAASDRRDLRLILVVFVLAVTVLVALGVWVNVDNSHKQKACRDRGGTLVSRGVGNGSVCVKLPPAAK